MTKIVNVDQNFPHQRLKNNCIFDVYWQKVNLILAKETHELDMFITHSQDPRLGSVREGEQQKALIFH